MTDSTPTPNKNAAVPVSTVDKVVSATPVNKAEKALTTPVPPQDSKKGLSPDQTEMCS